MSLVNDMLRDLDARRRDTPAKGVGAEKLIPATDQPGARASGGDKTSLMVVVIVLVVLGGAAAYYFQQSGESASGTLPQVNVPPAQQQPAMAENDSDADEQQALLALEARLQQLEQQNQQLLQQQQSAATPSPTNTVSTANRWQERDWGEPSVGVDDSAINQAQIPAPPPDLPQQAAGAASAEPPMEARGTLVRDSRPLSLNEQDRQQVQKALNEWADGQRLAALQTLDGFVYQQPTAHLSREMLAKLLIQQGEPGRAMQAVDMGLAISPNHAPYRKVKARLLIDAGRAAEAVVLLDDFPPSAVADAEYHDLMATAFLATQTFDRAGQTYRQLLQQDQTVGRWWYGLAVSMESQGRIDDAASAYERALQQSNLSAGLRRNSEQRLAELRPQP